MDRWSRMPHSAKGTAATNSSWMDDQRGQAERTSAKVTASKGTMARVSAASLRRDRRQAQPASAATGRTAVSDSNTEAARLAACIHRPVDAACAAAGKEPCEPYGTALACA